MRPELTIGEPIPIREYAKIVLLAPVLGAIGAGLMWRYAGFPIDWASGMALGGGLTIESVALLVTLKISQEDLESLRRYRIALAEHQPAAPDGFAPVPQYAQEVEASPVNLVTVPTGPGRGVVLHISGAQLRELKSRIRQNKFGLPVNGMKTFTSTEVKVLRGEVVNANLAKVLGSEVHWSPPGAMMILRTPPPPAL